MVRVRFAPSPTGELHIGGARTALYNYLFSRHEGGQFIVRIEDTDQERFVEGSLERILSGLHWLGLTWDEGPDIGGPYGPYIQSQRAASHHEYAEKLLVSGSAYWCFCSSERLDTLRQSQEITRRPTRYDRTCLTLSPEAVAAKLAQGSPKVLRLKVPTGTTTVHDLIHGDVVIQNETVDDQVLLKSDGFATYHLANVVDDHLMQITHVFRGEEWLPSTPKHLMLYAALGWQPPKFAHLPQVLNEQRAKLSKRRDGEIVWLATYQTQGYLPQAVVNFLALLGWHPPGDQEIYTLANLTQAFALERVQKAGAIFNRTKLNWFNAEYLRALAPAELNVLLTPYYTELSKQLGRVVTSTLELTQILQPRLVVLSDIQPAATWYFRPQLELSADLLIPKQGNPTTTAAALLTAMTTLREITSWEHATIKATLMNITEGGRFTRQELLWPVRVALTGERQSPDVVDVAWALGQTETHNRLTAASNLLA